MTYRPTPKVIGDIIPKVRVALNGTHVKFDGITPFYDYGTTTEVVNRLTKMTASTTEYDKKYPLIWLLIDDGTIHEKITPQNSVKRAVQNLQIVICTQSNESFTTAERYTNIVEPILRPIYDSLMSNIKKSKLVSSADKKYEHDYYENLFWGRTGLYGREGNIFNDRIDALIIDNLKLLIIKNC
ncbi:MAG: hypothetical protein KAS32_12340 [Candidatus Peribacteraceae bacterium]|nr:hypothetical protein [Candidatus Peribacteraceae bacterium]